MPYCREGHTLQDNESDDFRTLVPGVFFEIDIDGGTLFGIVDEYADPTEFSFLCRLYSDPARTILVTTPMTLAVPYDIRDFVGWEWEPKDIEQDTNTAIGTYVSNTVTIRDDVGVWVGQWIGEPKSDDTIQYNFRGSHTRFQAAVSLPQADEVAGAGLGAGTYTYCIVALDGSGKLGAGSRKLTITLAGAADVQLIWAPDSQVASWAVYGRIEGTIGQLAIVLTNTYTDDGTDVPNTGLKPPLFEDPLWTPVAPYSVAGTEGVATFSTTGAFDPVAEKLDDGTTITTFTPTGTTDYNDGVTGPFDLENLVSTTGVLEDVVVDSIFEGQPPPAIGTIVDYNYVTHVFINDAGNKVIYTRDEANNQEIEVEVFAVDGTFGITLTNDAGIFVSVVDIGDEVIPDVGSVNVNVSYEVTEITADGIILASQTLIANSYDTVILPGAVAALWIFTGQGSANIHARRSTDQLGSFDVDVAVLPNQNQLPGAVANVNNVAAVEDWVVTVDDLSATDIAFHWTNDQSLVSWFEDIAPRVVGATVMDEFIPSTIGGSVQNLEMGGNDNTFFGGQEHKEMFLAGVRCANGALICYQPVGQSPRTTFSTFWPETGDFTTFTFPIGAVEPAVLVWPAKNFLYVLASQSGPNNGEVYRYNIANNPVAPISNETLVYTQTGAPVALPGFMAASDTTMFVNSRVFAGGTHYTARTVTGDFTDVVVDSFANPTGPEDFNSEGMIRGSVAFKPLMGYIFNWKNFAQTEQRTYQSADGVTWSFTAHPLGFYNEFFPPTKLQGSNFCGSAFDGIRRYTAHGGVPAPSATLIGLRMQDVNLVDLGVFALPTPPVPANPAQLLWLKDETKIIATAGGGVRSVYDQENVDMRSAFGEPAFIPLDVATPPPPRQIADPSKSYIYDTRSTTNYNTEFRTTKQILEAASRGGAGNAVSTAFGAASALGPILLANSDIGDEYINISIPTGY